MLPNCMNRNGKQPLQHLAWSLSKSCFFREGRRLWKENQSNSQLSLSKFQKVIVGAYLILQDFSEGIFPPTFEDQQKVYDREISYSLQWPGLSVEDSFEVAQMKPFWFSSPGFQYLSDFVAVSSCLKKINVTPSMKLLELGCGTGWMSEFLAIMGFEVVGSTLSPHDIRAANMRVESLKVKGFDKKLSFIQTPMESIEKSLENDSIGTFDCIYVYEALHHAYNWQQTIESCSTCLKSGGWLLICNEPNLIHTMVSYRVSVLSETHEIGFNRSQLIAHIEKSGFRKPKILKNRIGFGIFPLWIAAQKR
ncbi:class I SAM-dependent methyltransferase [filamentous cyanobacterium CCT1]|nr:class I SAM-dependent methyltransferase [filamentous cyanobacterium CCT1]PSN80771.1 class I SAM-dependent methyltransferase [filamentous cyanobacterium CCP4]